MANQTQVGSDVVSRDDGTGSCSKFMQMAHHPLYGTLQLGDGGVRSGVGSFDLARNSDDGREECDSKKE
jgi:hypothetical protein